MTFKVIDQLPILRRVACPWREAWVKLCFALLCRARQPTGAACSALRAVTGGGGHLILGYQKSVTTPHRLPRDAVMCLDCLRQMQMQILLQLHFTSTALRLAQWLVLGADDVWYSSMRKPPMPVAARVTANNTSIKSSRCNEGKVRAATPPAPTPHPAPKFAQSQPSAHTPPPSTRPNKPQPGQPARWPAGRRQFAGQTATGNAGR